MYRVFLSDGFHLFSYGGSSPARLASTPACQASPPAKQSEAARAERGGLGESVAGRLPPRHQAIQPDKFDGTSPY